MDHSGASEGPEQGRIHSSPSAWRSKGQGAQSGQRPKVKITPFHSSPIAHSDGALHSKRPGAASGRLLESPGSLFVNTRRHVTAPPVRKKLSPAAAAHSSPQTPSSGSDPGEKPQEGPHVAKVT